MGGDFRQVGGDFLAKALDPEGPPPAQKTLTCLPVYIVYLSLIVMASVVLSLG